MGVEPMCSCAFQMHLLDAVEFWDKPSGIAEFKFDRTLWRVFIIFPRGMKCSLGGNQSFPSWESIVPLLGTFFTCYYVVLVGLKM